MFDNLKNAFSNAAKSFSEKELKEKDIENILGELEISLLESDVATEVIDSIKSDLKKNLIGTKVNKNEIENFVKQSLISSISNLFDKAGSVDLLNKIKNRENQSEPFIILFVGINGTGKTTTLAKLAFLLQESKFSLVVAASDTFRAGAIEQLREHTNRLNLKLVAQNYGSDPAAVARDAVLYAKSHKIDCVLIDTAGRMQTSKNLMDQISKISNVVKPHFKIFVGDSLAGNDTVNQAREFFNHVQFDGGILTKSDADARGGAALSIVTITSKPVLYVGVGQEYKDLKIFSKELFLNSVFGKIEPESISAEEEIGTPEKKIREEQTNKTEVSYEEKPLVKEIVKSKENQISEEIIDEDLFAGIETKDINKYVELYDIETPSNDEQARQLSIKIKNWIEHGRPKPGKIVDQRQEQKQQDKKKKSFFGRFSK